jgi:hypothetical protein
VRRARRVARCAPGRARERRREVRKNASRTSRRGDAVASDAYGYLVWSRVRSVELARDPR